MSTNPMYMAAKAAADNDDNLRTAFVSKAGMTATLAFSLMNLKNGWIEKDGTKHDGYVTKLQDLQYEYLTTSLLPGDDKSALARALMMKYTVLSSQSDMADQQWNAIIQSNSSGLEELNHSREENIASIEPLQRAQHFAIGLSKRPI